MDTIKAPVWGQNDWIVITPSAVMHLLHGKAHPLCRKTMPKGQIIHSKQELDKWDDEHPSLLEELCRNCQTVATGERA